jgi:hypothetical protein
MKCNKTLSKWCKNKHGASKIIDMFETYQGFIGLSLFLASNYHSSVNCEPLVALVFHIVAGQFVNYRLCSWSL